MSRLWLNVYSFQPYQDGHKVKVQINVDIINL